MRKETIGEMMELVVGTAVLVPSLYWTAAVVASVKTMIQGEDR